MIISHPSYECVFLDTASLAHSLFQCDNWAPKRTPFPIDLPEYRELYYCSHRLEGRKHGNIFIKALLRDCLRKVKAAVPISCVNVRTNNVSL